MKLNTSKDIVFYIVIISYFIGLIFIPIDTNIVNKIINGVGIVVFIMLIISNDYKFNKGTLILALGLLALGVIDALWYVNYKTDHVIYKNGYRGYWEVGKMLAANAFVLLYVQKNRKKVNIKFHIIASLSAQVIIYAVAGYQSIWLHADRISLSAMGGAIGQMGAATIAAYMIVFCSLYSAIVFINVANKYKWVFFYTNFVLSLSAVIMTGTRAAIFTYPLMIAAILFIHYYKQRAFLFKSLGGLCGLLLACGLVFNQEVSTRFDNMKSDINHYVGSENSTSSIGARFSMIMAGFESAPNGLAWQSLEQRATKIIALSKENSVYEGATLFLDVHMHNEIIEALSTKGIIGVIVLFFFYAALIYYCFAEKKYLLLVFPATIMLFGISDVITHDKPIPASWIICFFLSSLLPVNKEEK